MLYFCFQVVLRFTGLTITFIKFVYHKIFQFNRIYHLGSSNTGDGGGKSDSKKVKMMDSADFKRITLNEDTAGVKGYGKQTFGRLNTFELFHSSNYIS